MKKIAFTLALLPIILSCLLYTTPPLGETSFPLKKYKTIPFEENIEEIVVGDTWMAVRTKYDTVTALDINTLEILWSQDIPIEKFLAGFQIANDILTIVSAEEIKLIDKAGNQKEFKVDDDLTTVNKVLAATSGYIYVVGGPKWNLGVYSIAENKMLWKSNVGRGVGIVFYDPTNNIAYLTKDDSITAYENSSGKVLWKKENVYGNGALFDSRILYVSAVSNIEGAFKLTAIEGISEEIIWEKDIMRPTDIEASSSTVISNLLINGGYGMFAIDKTNGELLWTIPSIGFEYVGTPVEFDDVIYIKEVTGTVFAISPIDGAIIGHVKLEEQAGFDKVYRGVHSINDGIIFSTKNDLVVYKPE